MTKRVRDEQASVYQSVIILDVLEHLTAMTERINSKCNSKVICACTFKSESRLVRVVVSNCQQILAKISFVIFTIVIKNKLNVVQRGTGEIPLIWD